MQSREGALFIGVIHLLPLPGSPRGGASLTEIVDRAVEDATALHLGGVHALIVENFGDAPFDRGPVSPVTVAAMTRAALAVRAALPERISLGINVLRNDPLAALGIASVVGASFVRINVHTGAMVTDQGLIEGEARATLLERRRIGIPVQIAADVLVKHAVPLGPLTLEDSARDTAERGLADAIILTGSGTGRPTDPDHVRRVRAVLPKHVPVWVGSGLRPEDVPRFVGLEGAIVGSWLHRDARLDAPVDVERVRQMASALQATNKPS